MTTSINLILSAEIILRYRIRISLRQTILFTDKSDFSNNDHFDLHASFQEPLKSGVSERAHSQIASKAMSEFGGESLASLERSQLAKPRFLRSPADQTEDREENERPKTLQSNRFDVRSLFVEKATPNNEQSRLSETERKIWKSGTALQFQSLSTIASAELNTLKAKALPFNPNADSWDSTIEIENDVSQRKMQSPVPIENSPFNNGNIKYDNRSAIESIGRFAIISQTFVTLKPLKSSLLWSSDGLTGEILKRKKTLFSPLRVMRKASAVILHENDESGSDAGEDLVRIKRLFGNRNQKSRDFGDYNQGLASARQLMSSVVSETRTQEATNENSRIKDFHAHPIFKAIPVTPNLAIGVEGSHDVYGWTTVGDQGLNSLVAKRRLQQEFFSGIVQMSVQSLEGAAFAERKRKRLEAERAGRR